VLPQPAAEVQHARRAGITTNTKSQHQHKKSAGVMVQDRNAALQRKRMHAT
jgi:hypothetical protein